MFVSFVRSFSLDYIILISTRILVPLVTLSQKLLFVWISWLFKFLCMLLHLHLEIVVMYNVYVDFSCSNDFQFWYYTLQVQLDLRELSTIKFKGDELSNVMSQYNVDNNTRKQFTVED